MKLSLDLLISLSIEYACMKQDKTLFELQSEVCKTLASPKRLEILNALKEGEKTVTELVEILGVPKANVSQHLAVMRHKGILKTRREGVNIYYAVSNAKVIQACILMREVLTEQMQEKSKLIDIVAQG
jgi:ArsR family transcriptional regulator